MMWVASYRIASAPQRRVFAGYVSLDKASRISVTNTGTSGSTPALPYDNKFGILIEGPGIPVFTYLAFFNTQEDADNALTEFITEAGFARIESTVEEAN